MQPRKCTDRSRASAAALCALWDHYGFLWRIPGLMAFTSRSWFTACQFGGCPLGRGRRAEGGVDIKPVVKVLAVKTKSGTPSHSHTRSFEAHSVWKETEKVQPFKCSKAFEETKKAGNRFQFENMLQIPFFKSTCIDGSVSSLLHWMLGIGFLF